MARHARTGVRQQVVHISCIVEGAGEMKAVPELIGRGADLLQPGLSVRTSMLLGSRGDFQKQRVVEKLVKTAAIRLQGSGGILILFDSDDVCPATLGPQVYGWARTAAGGIPVGVVLAHREYEAWLLAGATGLGGRQGLPRGLRPPANPESVPDAKVWLSDKMPSREQYSPTRHQAALTRHFALQDARRRAPSFDKCLREPQTIITAIQATQQKDDKHQ